MATAKVKYHETANGPAYSLGDTTIVFMYGTGPHLLWNGNLVKIDQPTGFGSWGTPAAQRAFVRRFKGVNSRDSFGRTPSELRRGKHGSPGQQHTWMFS